MNPRRPFDRSFVAGSLLMSGIPQELLAVDAGRGASTDPLVPRAPLFTPRAKNVIVTDVAGDVVTGLLA